MKRILLGGLLFVAPCVVFAQSQESAFESRASLKVGAEFSSFNPDFYCRSSSPFSCDGGPLLKGIGVFGDYNLRPRWGAEGEARWLRWDGLGGQVESTYLIGPRYRFYRWKALYFWTKFLVGDGSITTENYPGPNAAKGDFFVYSMGASVDYKLSRKFSLRGDYEWQRWPSFAPQLAPHNHGIVPNGFSLGVAYTIAGH